MKGDDMDGMTDYNGGSAFPCPPVIELDGSRIWVDEWGRGGMSLRDYYAAKAMQAILASHSISIDAKQVADWAHDQATMMLEVGRSLDEEEGSRLEILDAIDRLRANEGSSVEILCPGPEPHNPNQAINVMDDWTGYTPRRFEGDTLLECLRKAEEAKRVLDAHSAGV